MKQVYYFVGLAFLLITCCKKDPDPCEAIRNEPGGFTVTEMFNSKNSIEARDTVCINLIRFSSKRIYDSYTWWIGQEAEPRSGKSVDILLPPNPKVRIMLIGRRSPQTACLPGDDGIDTFTQFLTVVPYDSSRALGKYQGYMAENPADTFTINILKMLRNDWCSTTGHYMLNMPKNSTPSQPAKYCMPRIYMAYDGFIFEDEGTIDTNVPNPVGRKDGKAQLESNLKTIKIDFYGWKPGNDQTINWQPMQFIGKRVE